jgi:IS4 transposase
VFYDEEKKKRLVFVTNNMELPAWSVALLYKSRWQVELFFKWIKQHLRIKSFFGYTENALRCQIWIALSVYLLVAIIKRELHMERSIYEILQILSVTPFEKMPIISILEQTQVTKNDCEVAKHRFLWD